MLLVAVPQHVFDDGFRGCGISFDAPILFGTTADPIRSVIMVSRLKAGSYRHEAICHNR